MAYFIAYVETKSIGSRIERTFEVPDDELSDCDTDAERDELIAFHAQETIADQYEWGWEES